MLRAVRVRGTLEDSLGPGHPPDEIETGLKHRDAICQVLTERYESGETDVAARHNEHQP